MAIGRTEDRDTPWDPVMLQHRKSVRDPIRATHLGQRSIRSHTQAGHMTAIDQTRPSCKNPCNPAAVHTWIPAFAGMTVFLLSPRQLDVAPGIDASVEEAADDGR